MAQEIKKQEPRGAAAPRYRDPFADVRAEMDRVFDSFLGRSLFGRPSLFGRADVVATVAPDIDIRENDKEIVLEAELPSL
jgi:HSP20 family molecular chaperone IbpA